MQSSSEENSLIPLESQKRGSLRNTALMILLPLSLISITLVAGITYLRGRSAIENQVNTQLNANMDALRVDFDKWLTTKLIRLDLAVRGPELITGLESALEQENHSIQISSHNREIVINELKKVTQRGDDLLFNHFFIALPSGKILLSTQPDWEQENITNAKFFPALATEPGSLVVYNPEPLYKSETIVITSIPYYDEHGQHQATVFGISKSISLIGLLEEVSRFNPSAQSYLLTRSGDFIRVDPYQKILTQLEPSDQQSSTLLPMMESISQAESPPQNNILELSSFDGTPVIANFTWLPSLRAGIIIEIPTEIAFGELNTLGPYLLMVTLFLGVSVVAIISVATKRLITPIQLLTKATEEFANGNWDQRALESGRNEVGQLSQAFNLMADDLEKSYRSLEVQVQERTLSLENRTRQLEATAHVAREAAAIQTLDALLTDTTHLISTNFGFYHVGIFLLDSNHQFAVLQAANSEGGQRMLARSHRLAVGQVGVVGYVSGTGLPRIALDVGEDAHYFDNPDLPATRSELALPLKIHNRVIGVLDVQSTEPGAFEGPEIEVLQILADQVAVSIENARLLEQSQQAIHELHRASGEQIRSDWSLWRKDQAIAYAFDRVRMSPATPEQLETTRSLDTGNSNIQHAHGNTFLTVPIQLRDQKLGSIILERDGTSHPWTPEDLEIVRTSITQIAIALENARLLDESLRLASHEQTVGEFSTQFSQSMDIDSILRAAVTKLGQLPDIADVSVQIGDINPE